MHRSFAAIALVALIFAGATPAMAQAKQTISFAKGTRSKLVKGSITGDSYVDYLVNAGKGQLLNVDLKQQGGSAYFNVMSPGSDSAVHIGSSDGDSYTGPVTVTGNQVIRVYQMRATARRGAKAGYSLTVGVGGKRG